MKKLFIVLTAAAIALSLCACSSGSGKESSKGSSEESSVSSSASQAGSSSSESIASQEEPAASGEASEEVSEEVSAEASEEASSDIELTPLQQSLEKVKAEVTFPTETSDFSAKRVKRTFGIEEDQMEDFAGLFCTDGVSQDQIIYIKAKTEDDVPAIQQALQDNWQATYNVIKNYTPEQAAIIEAAEVETNGTVVSLVISADADKIKSIFSENIG